MHSLFSYITKSYFYKPFLISRRHSIHLAVNTADTPEFRLSNFARVARGQMAAARAGARGILPNPFTIDQNCDPNAEFRRINGTCNNLQQPFRGAAKIPLERLQNNTYEDGVESPTRTFFRSAGDLPSARMVSLVVHETTSNLSNRNSHLLMNFGQFTDHDVTLSPEANAEGGEEESPKEICCEPNSARARAFSTVEFSECFNIPTPNDPFLNDSCMPFIRSAISPRLPGAPEVRFQLNDLTAFVDASQVYGVTLNRANSLREFRGGLLRISRGLNNEERLPPRRDNPPDCFTISNMECRFAAGDSRTSEQAGLTSVHTLFLREHNKIVRELVKLNPTWSDERLYQVSLLHSTFLQIYCLYMHVLIV
ncbi:hypothetical protein EB796_012543 [Bugula neritina]|uniref:PXDN n=1 Tax=Bugula neritina TaxID=10212 RepID=A0A7J7JUX3_BUGNE|nr:hypothetical protein EB796_012543 [Bugula neritina]